MGVVAKLLFSLTAAALVVAPSSANARWLEAHSPNFIVSSEGSEESLRRSVGLLEDYDRLLRTLTGTTAPPSPAPLAVYLVGSEGDLKGLATIPSGALGFYRARIGGTAAYAVRGDQFTMAGQEILFHEYAHHFMNRYYPAAYPTWYREGFAEYMMTARFLPDRVEVGRYNPGRAILLLRGQWLPVERILTSSYADLKGEQLPQFYAESWLIVHYLFAAPERREALTRYLAERHRGTPEAAAFQTAFGMDHRAFDEVLRRYRGGRIGYGSETRDPGSPVPLTIRPLPASADELLLRQSTLNAGLPDAKMKAENIAAIRVAAARYPEDSYARRVLARAEIESGDRAKGAAMIERLIAETPVPDAELFYYRALADFFIGKDEPSQRAERYAAAEPWFAKAVAADPNYYSALYRLALTRQTRADNTSEDVLQQFIAAHQLAPLVSDIALDAARALAAHQRYEEAEAALLPIATDPHGGGASKAQALLTSIREKTEPE